MSEYVDNIERFFEMPRHRDIHYGLLEDDVFYIMHSGVCVDFTPDLTKCDYSLAMDNGFGQKFGEDVIYDLRIEHGKLVGDW